MLLINTIRTEINTNRVDDAQENTILNQQGIKNSLFTSNAPLNQMKRNIPHDENEFGMSASSSMSLNNLSKRQLQNQQSLVNTPGSDLEMSRPDQTNRNRQKLKLSQFESMVNSMYKNECYSEENKEEAKEQKSNVKLCTNEGLNLVWKHKGLRIIRLISKFIQQVKRQTEKVKYRLISQKVFSLIKDKSADYETFSSVKIKKKLTLQFQQLKQVYLRFSSQFIGFLDFLEEKFDQRIQVLQPDSGFKMIWDSIVVFFIVINIFYIPMRISFSIDKSNSAVSLLLLETIPSYIFMFEIVLNFNTAYYHEGIIHTQRKEIFKHYVTGNFLWDLVVIIPFLLSQLNIPYLDFTLLLRVTRVRAMVENLEDALNLQEYIQAIFDLFKSVYFIIFVSHFCGCAWHYLGWYEYTSNQKSWILTHQLEDDPWTSRYIYSIYWSTITTLTVGYGDVVPITLAERIFVIIITLIACGVLAYTISNIGEIFKNLQEKESNYKARIKIINKHIQKRGLSKNLQLKVRKYFEHYFLLEQDENQEAECLMSKLTRNLNEEVSIDIYKKTLVKSRLLKENFSDYTINQLSLRMKEKKCVPEEMIYTSGDTADKLLFILSGELELYANKQTILRRIGQGQVIGEREFAMHSNHDHNCRTIAFTQIAYLEFSDFNEVLKSSPDELEKFSLIKDNLIFNQYYKNLGQVCEFCQWTHSYLNCPFIENYQKFNQFISKQTVLVPLPFKIQDKSLKTKNRHLGKRFNVHSYKLNQNRRLFQISDVNDSYLEDLGFHVKDKDVSESSSELQPRGKLTIFRESNMVASLPTRKFSIIRAIEESRNNTNPEELELMKDTVIRDITKKTSLTQKRFSFSGSSSQKNEEIQSEKIQIDRDMSKLNTSYEVQVEDEIEEEKFKEPNIPVITTCLDEFKKGLQKIENLFIQQNNTMPIVNSRENNQMFTNPPQQQQFQINHLHYDNLSHLPQNLDLDRMQRMKIYFPLWNIQVVLKKINDFQELARKRVISKKQFKKKTAGTVIDKLKRTNNFHKNTQPLQSSLDIK